MATTLAATVDVTGISGPSFDTVLTTLQETYKSLYGSDIYLGADSQDGQLLAIFATAIHDCIDSAISVYNDFSPSTAQGAGLSSVVKVNGITRQVSTQSTVSLTLVGQAGTQVVNGLVGDNLNLGSRWEIYDTATNQPTTVTIGSGGFVVCTARCIELGSTTASAGTLTNILNPQLGWQTVNNPSAAAPGAPVETDAQLRRRQSRSAALPAVSTLNGIFAAVADVDGVARAAVYENDHGYTDERGIPAHSIAVVFEGGDANAVAQAVALKKPPGVQTYGILHPVVFDSRGVPNQINLYPLNNIRCSALIFVDPGNGYISSTSGYIRQSMSAFYTNLQIAEAAYLTRAYGPANLETADAEWGTGFTEPQLELISDTYHVTEIAQARSDMVTWADHNYGTNYVYPAALTNYAVGQTIYIDLDDGTHHRTEITGVFYPTQSSAGYLTFAPAVPGGRYIPASRFVYVVGDILATEFWVAYFSDTADLQVILPPP